MRQGKQNVGRPQKDPSQHPHRHAVILYDVYLRFGSLAGKNFSERFFADTVVLAVKRYGWTYEPPVNYSGPPHDGYSGSSLRKRPIKRIFKDGYCEIAVGHVTDNEPKRYHASLADLVRKTHTRWLKREEVHAWLYVQSYFCAMFIFPQISSLLILKRHLQTS
jgi:hypothetical protein